MSESYNQYQRLSERIDRIRRIQSLQDTIVSDKQLNDVLKMHQRTTWHKDIRPLSLSDNNLVTWIDLVTMTDTLPVHSEKSIPLEYNDEFDSYDTGSIRHFKPTFSIEFRELSHIFLKAFGRQISSKHKSYPSAGGIYPIIPILIVLETKVLEGIEVPGTYIYNATDHEFILLKNFKQQDMDKVIKNIDVTGLENNKLAIAYAIDLKRTITKYRIRGYRHSLIEIGLMAQSFRQSVSEFERLGEVCWSGFNDNALTHALGLSPRLAPVALLQWFGEKHDF